MKKLYRYIISIILSVTALTGCEAMLDTLLTDPLFSAGEIWFDGQTYQIVKMGTCEYEFEVDCDYVKIEQNEDKKFIASVNMPDEVFNEGKEVMLTIVARNADDPEIEPVEQEVRLCPWTIAVFDKNNTPVSKMKTNNGDYTIKMAMTTKVPIPAVLFGGGLNHESNPQAINWTFPGLTLVDSTESTLTVSPTEIGTYTVTAQLGKRKVTKTFEVEMGEIEL